MTALIELSEYNPSWPKMFQSEKLFLERVAGEWLYGAIEHVGSTSVTGLVAKPVIDIMFGVRNLRDSMAAIEVLEKNGYCYAPYKTSVMHWFCKPSANHRTHHLHLVPFNSLLWHQRIEFRDALRSDKELAFEYVSLKRNLAAKYEKDRELYTDKKWLFIKRVLEQENG
jgi:GrpB-like predicted nucleotidyltransferase (UPF0157 family)